MLKIDLITGFLGAGKTTFLLKYAKYLLSKGLRVGILEYDYGAVNIDIMLLNGLRSDKCELEMLAAACDEDCLRRRFTTKLIAMAMSGYDRVIIEPSGVFDIDMFYDALREEPLENMYEIGNVFTVVSADMEDDLNDEGSFLLASQAAGAGLIVISKSQLFPEAKLQTVHQLVEESARKINCRNFNPRYYEKDWNTLQAEDYEFLLKAGYQIPSYTKVTAGTNLSFSSVSSLKVPDGIERIKEKLTTLFTDTSYGKVHRIKGFIGDHGQNYQINATKEVTTLTPMNSGRGTIIVIGTDLNRAKITALLESE